MTFLERAKELVSKMTLEEKISQMCHEAPAIERLGIPAYNWWSESLHGVARTGCATVFPQAIGMAASFNTDLIEEVGKVIATEARAKYNENKLFGEAVIYQGLTECAPNINIFRDPRWGRGQETYGEDPYLTARMGTAYVKGIQGDGKYRKVDATLKHYAVHSGPESMRHGFNAVVDDEVMFSTYLYAFKYIIDNADPTAVMGAYNAVNGEPASGGKRLLMDILYGQFGFKGIVVSDAGSIANSHLHHKCTKDETESAALALNNGMQLNIGTSYTKLGEAYERGIVSEETITHAVEKLFEVRFRLGMFDDDCEYDKIPYDVIECDEHRKLNRKMATESAVLLKNDGILPLDDTKTIAVIGPMADDKLVLLGNYSGTPSIYSTLLRGIQDASRGRVLYARGSNPFAEDENPCLEKPMHEALIAAKYADVVVLCVGINPSYEGEESDAPNSACNGDRDRIEMPEIQMELINKVLAVGKPTVLVNTSGSCIGLDFADKQCNAGLQYFYPGAEGGAALADILFGKVSPSGRLPVTFYRATSDLPPFEDYSMKNRTYKFYDGKPVYEFGHGLTYSEIEENWISDKTVEIYNKGEFDTGYSVLRFEYIPHKSLADFKKIFIRKGEKITVNFD